MSIPAELRTERLILRPWRAEDAAEMQPILEANWEHLSPWIPARVATPSPIGELAERLADFAAQFAANREWRYGMFARDDQRMLGEVSLFPRGANGRVPFEESDRAEIGYWLREDETGRGLVTEAVRAVFDAARAIERFSLIEIRCDARNTASAAVPQRLGFVLDATIDEGGEPPVQLQVWVTRLPTSAG